jgi:hypothetical protein
VTAVSWRSLSRLRAQAEQPAAWYGRDVHTEGELYPHTLACDHTGADCASLSPTFRCVVAQRSGGLLLASHEVAAWTLVCTTLDVACAQADLVLGEIPHPVHYC